MAENTLVADVEFVFTVDTRELRLRFRSLPIAAWEELYDAHGLEPLTLVQRTGAGSPVIAAILIWLERKQRERRLTWAQARREIEQEGPTFELLDIRADGKSVWHDEDEAEPVEDPPTQAGD